MFKISVYPKTQRYNSQEKIIITEKLDGSNLVLFTDKENSDLYIAQRNTVIMLSEIEDAKDLLYKGLYQWLVTHGESIKKALMPERAICGEWLGMGKLKYDFEDGSRFFMFAKGLVKDFNGSPDTTVTSLVYNPDLLKYAFTAQEIMEPIKVVPIVGYLDNTPGISDLDAIYDTYVNFVQRAVEGFIIIDKNQNIVKYVRHKNGKLTPHTFKGGNDE